MDHCQAAVTHVRSQAMAVRKTTAEYLRGELLRGEHVTSGDPKWPSILSGFHMSANQVAELAEEIDPVLNFFAYQPLRATANSGDIPMFLSTKLMPRTEGDTNHSETEDFQDESRNHVEEVEHFNGLVDEICTFYQGAADEMLSKLSSSSRR